MRACQTVGESRSAEVEEAVQQPRGYYERESQNTSMRVIGMLVFAAPPALLLGGLADLVASDTVAAIATAFGAVLGFGTFALCNVSSQCSREEEDREKRS